MSSVSILFQLKKVIFNSTKYIFPNCTMLARLRIWIILFLALFLLWWVGKAIVRYWSQPVSTDISYSFGDHKNGIKFPQITLCHSHFTENNPILRNCLNNSTHNFFLPTVKMCMKNKKFHIDAFMRSLTSMKNKVIFATELFTGSTFVKLQG